MSSSWSRNDKKKTKTTLISQLTDDLLENIVSRLPARSFAAAACVNSPWNRICNHVLSRPKLSSALSLNPSLQVAVREVVEKVLSEPIRPDFAIVSVGSGFRLSSVFHLISKRLGTKTPIIVSTATGIIGVDALSDELIEVKWDDFGVDLNNDDGFAIAKDDENFGIVLTVGFLPGIKVDVIPLLRSTKEPRKLLIDEFVTDIMDYTVSVSGGKSPIGIILFGGGVVDMKPIVNTLDYAMSKETVIVGDENGRFLYRSRDESRNFCSSAKFCTAAVALTFAEDRNSANGIGDIRFHSALSNGLSEVGPRYKAVSVKEHCSNDSTWLTARIEGQRAVLDGQQILNDIYIALENDVDSHELYIGVTEKRKFSIASEKPRLLTSLSFHGILGGDEEYLYVNGTGIRTGDCFQFYRSNADTALNSVNRVSLQLKNIKSAELRKNSSFEVFGGLVFACCGRGNPFFTKENMDCLPFTENFSRVPFGGIFCRGEIGRLNVNSESENIARSCLHAYSTVYLAISYTPRLR